MRLRHGLFAKLLVSYIALSLFSMVLLAGFSFESAATVLHKKIVQASGLALRQIGENIESLIVQAITSTSLTMMDSNIEHDLVRHYGSAFQRLKADEQVESLLSQYTSVSLGNPLQIILVGVNGLTATNTQAETTLTRAKLPLLPWYASVRPTNRQLSWIGLYQSYIWGRSDKQMLSAAKTLVDPYTGRNYGTLVLQIDVGNIARILPESIGPERSITVLDSHNRIVATTSHSPVGSLAPDIVRRLLVSPQRSEVVRTGGISTLYLVNRLPIGHLSVLETIAVPVLDQEIYVLGDHVLLILLIALLVSIGCAYFAAKRISMPLVRLRNRITKVSTGGAKKHSEIFADEATAIFDSYSELVRKLESTVDELVREQKEKRNAEMHALQMQINPHFLFNTLKSIKSLVWTNRSEQIETVIDSLVRLLERSIRNTDELETLSDQIELLAAFVHIQEVRLDRRINLTVQMPNEVRRCHLPKLILQPLVENSIVHGIEAKGDEGQIWLIGSIAGDTVSIEILDNGAGFDDCSAGSRLNATVAVKPGEELHHIGLTNVDARLRAFFGRKYRMKIKSQPGAGTSVLLSFPLVHAEIVAE